MWLGGGVLGRIDQMVTVRGINVYPSALDNIIRGHAAVDEYEVHIRADRAMDELVLKVEVAVGVESPFASVRLRTSAAKRFKRVDRCYRPHLEAPDGGGETLQKA